MEALGHPPSKHAYSTSFNLPPRHQQSVRAMLSDGIGWAQRVGATTGNGAARGGRQREISVNEHERKLLLIFFIAFGLYSNGVFLFLSYMVGPGFTNLSNFDEI
jgi:hypothetical protein